MRPFLTFAVLAGAALAVAACGDRDEAANEAAANTLDANLTLEAPANDASALETAVPAAEPAPIANGTAGNDSEPVLGETSGGDTGGNTVESNVSGM